MQINYDDIKKFAREAGFDLCGVARARILGERLEPFEAGLRASGEGVLGYLARDPARRLDPSALLGGARTVVVCAVSYPVVDYSRRSVGSVAAESVDFDESASGGDVGEPVAPVVLKTASYALIGEDYHVRIKAMLRGVLERLREEWTKDSDGQTGQGQGQGQEQGQGQGRKRGQGQEQALRAKVCCDTSPILEKGWAVEAGLGWQGRNSLLINPARGSFLLLGEIVLDAECDRYDDPYEGDGCGGCRLCEEACPVGALSGRAVDTGRCISALTVERARKGLDTEPLHGWVYGCDECQTACPHNRHLLV